LPNGVITGESTPSIRLTLLPGFMVIH